MGKVLCDLDATWMLLGCYLGFSVTVSGKMITFTILLFFKSIWETAEGWYATWVLLGCYLGKVLCDLDATWMLLGVFCECIR